MGRGESEGYVMPPEAKQAMEESVRDLGAVPDDLEYAFERDDVAKPPVPARKMIDDPIAAFLLDSGLLFEINRRVLHPLGLALEVSDDRISGIWDCRSDPEGIYFDDETFEAGVRKLKAYMNERGTKAIVTRTACLGYKVQGDLDD
jgi:hypothetical protein